ncbi:ferric reductase [Bisporella sp. PMI_857]|nr:ferric reductase [Bisporella sp. PMI_857]
MSSISLAAKEAEETPEDLEATDENLSAVIYLATVWIVLFITFMIYHFAGRCIRYQRRVACMSNPTQRLFAQPGSTYAWFKRNIFDAPLFRTRHHREYKLFRLNMGYLPSRLQAIILVGYILANVALSMIFIDPGSHRAFEDMRDRTGVLSIVNLLPIVILGGRNNPLIGIMGLSFDTFNLAHRWFGRTAIIHSIAHVVFFLLHEVRDNGWDSVQQLIAHDVFYTSGTAAFAAFILIFIQACSPVRHAFYEIFLHFHIFLFFVACAGIWVHCQSKDLFQLFIVQIVLALWFLERLFRLGLIIVRNRGGTNAEVELLPGDCLRINLKIARPWRFKSGQHVYLYMPKIGWWTSHPFSLAWSQGDEDSERQFCLEHLDKSGLSKVSMSLLVRRRSGFTNALFQRAEATPEKKFTISALVEGPYGYQDLTSYGTVILFAAGVGITHQVSHLRSLLQGYRNSTAAVRRITLVWMIQSADYLEWINPWLAEALSSTENEDLLKVLIYVTRSADTVRWSSPPGILIFPGKPDIAKIVDTERASRIGACAISVCGTGSLGDDVRSIVRARQGKWSIDFFEESFSW